MIPVKEVFFFVLIQTTLSQGWPASNYSRSAETYGIGALDDEVDWTQHPCRRECKDNEAPMTCRYGFTVENYATMSKACYDCPVNLTDCYRPHCLPGDGIPRIMFAVNRQLPGPSIEVCKEDRIIVDVKNMLNGESTTIHWHGLHQRGTPFMDGVPMVSQCPIAAGDSFRYEFLAGNAGTHWWHSHSGAQRSDAMFGALIVRSPPSQNLVGQLYDHDEHWIILNEWNERTFTDFYTLQYVSGNGSLNVHTILINGLGRYEGTNKSALIPRHVFHVKQGTRNRFRVTNAASFACIFIISVHHHPMLVVSSDGSDVEPLEVDSIRLVPGERYDFILNANRKVDNYWIRVTGTDNCKLKSQLAILRYQGASDAEPMGPNDFLPAERQLNPIQGDPAAGGGMCVSCSLTSLEPDHHNWTPIPDQQIYLSLDGFTLDNAKFHRKNYYDTNQVQSLSLTLHINHLSFKQPHSPLQTQPALIKDEQLCNVTEARCTRVQCSCPYVVQIKLNSTVEMVFVSEATHKRHRLQSYHFTIPHAMHLHGFYFRVLAMEKLGDITTVEEVRAWDQAGKIHRKLKDAPRKDVIDVPSGGYTVVRFLADNPGYWFFHCHFESHSYNGMAMVLKVGEHKDFPAVPKGFPKCHYRI